MAAATFFGNYHENVTLAVSGTASAPIILAAYTGETPTLIGASPVPGPWSVYSGSIYSTPWPTQPMQVFSGGHLLNEARWPNSLIEDLAGMTYATADAGNATSLTEANLPSVDLTGAWIRIMAGQAGWAMTARLPPTTRPPANLTGASPSMNSPS